MKWLTPLFFVAAAMLNAADAPPFIFSGVLQENSIVRVALTATPGGDSKWVDIGEQFQGYQIVSYDENTTTLLVLKDYTEISIILQEAKIKSTSNLTPETRAQIRENLSLLWSAAQQYFLEKGKTSAVFSELVGKGKSIESLAPICGENYASLVFIADSKAISVVTLGGETVSYADIFYAVKAGDSLAKIARANKLALTDLLALNPDVSWTKLRVGQVVVVGAEPR